MRKRLTIFCMTIALLALAPAAAFAGSLNSPGAPTNAASESYTLEDIYKRVCATESVTKSTFTEPSAGPTAGTGYPLNQIYRMIQAADAATGQNKCYDPDDSHNEKDCESCTGDCAGQDGKLQKGVAWTATARFTNNGDGTVTDKLTGLIWLKDADCMGKKAWGTATDETFDVIGRLNGSEDFSCSGYTAGSFNDWRLPNVRELSSLTDFSQSGLPSGHLFTDVKSDRYWTSTTYADDTAFAWGVSLEGGHVGFVGKLDTLCVWPVRAGQ